LRQERAQRVGSCGLHVGIIKERGSCRPDGVDTTVRDRLATVLRLVVREELQSKTRCRLHMCICRMRLEGAHHSIDSAGSAHVQPK
jgi:hypothetical protein